MTPRPFAQVDVFTDQPYLGNPLAVVLDGTGLSTAQMQAFTNWTNLSEATFVLPPTHAEADYSVRIFCPGRELPFAGHPTVGTAVLLADLRSPAPSNDNAGERDSLVVLEEGIGIVRVGVRSRTPTRRARLSPSRPAGSLGHKAGDVTCAVIEVDELEPVSGRDKGEGRCGLA